MAATYASLNLRSLAIITITRHVVSIAVITVISGSILVRTWRYPKTTVLTRVYNERNKVEIANHLGLYPQRKSPNPNTTTITCSVQFEKKETAPAKIVRFASIPRMVNPKTKIEREDICFCKPNM